MNINEILSFFSTHLTLDHILIIIQLVILEGLLSFDNAIALAALVRKNLPHAEDRKKALMWGIWGAYILRTVVIFIGVWLMAHKWVQAVAGLYLVYLCISELFFNKKDGEDKILGASHEIKKVTKRIFWMTVVQVELLDLMFSIDSVAVALAISDVAWVLVVGAILGILLMRFAAQIFIKLLDKFPLLEKAAFILIGVAGVNVLLKLDNLNLGFTTLSINIHISEAIFFSTMVFIILFTIALQPIFNKFSKK